jgi:hypothetical protein
MIYPIDPELDFLLWIEETKKSLPNGAVFHGTQQFHVVYSLWGLQGAIEWLEKSVLHPAGKGHNAPIFADGYNHFLIAILELGLSNPATRTATRDIILEKHKFYTQGENHEKDQ